MGSCAAARRGSRAHRAAAAWPVRSSGSPCRRPTAARDRPWARGRNVLAASCRRWRRAPWGDASDLGAVGGCGANVSDEENLIARPVRTAAAMRRRRVRLLWQRAKRRARVLRRAAQRLRPPVASTPRTVALVQAMPPRGPRAARMRHASAGLSATTVAYGGEKGTPSSSSRGWTQGCAVCARARAT